MTNLIVRLYFPNYSVKCVSCFNTERYSLSLLMQSERGEIQTRITPNTDTFHAVRGIEVKYKTFSLASYVLSFRHAKQTSKNVADTTFKGLFFSQFF